MSCNSTSIEKKISVDNSRLISLNNLKYHVQSLASDSLQGRSVGSEGQLKSARYIANFYSEIGLESFSYQKNYYQNYSVQSISVDSVQYKIKNVLNHELILETSNNRMSGIYPLNIGTNTIDGEILFAGFGIYNSSRKINHLEGIDIRGKWVLAFKDIPHIIDSDTIVDPSIDATQRYIQVLLAGGAKGLLLMTLDDNNYNKGRHLSNALNEPIAFRPADEIFDSIIDFGYNVLSPEISSLLLGFNNEFELQQLYHKIISNPQKFKAFSLGKSLRQTSYSSNRKIESNNIVAVLKGNDPLLRNKFIVVTAHYDHLQTNKKLKNKDNIYNGADDNASGVASILEIANTLKIAKSNGLKIDRSIIFLNLSGEEIGLFGSKYFVTNPPVPLDNIVANINIDMIGRVDKKHEKLEQKYIYVIGADLVSSDLERVLNNSVPESITLDKSYNNLHDSKQLFKRSDHWSFGKENIPFIFFTGGLHDDYHTVDDEWDRINYNLLQVRTRVVLKLLIALLNTKSKPKIDNKDFLKYLAKHVIDKN